MGADLSRDTFDPHRQYAGVLLQQGRVLLDADFNEQVDITRARDAMAGVDTVGQVGVPRTGGGFAIGLQLDISPGRIWIDGVPVENDPEQTSAAATNATDLNLESSTLDEAPLATGDLLEVLTQPPATFAITAVVGSIVTLSGLHGVPAGAAIAVRRRVTLKRQPFAYPALPPPTTPGRYVAMLRARVVETGPEDQATMAEPALGGVDTSVRRRVVWQVQLHRIGPSGKGSCSDWAPPPRLGRLRPVLNNPTLSTGDCALPADAQFQGVENSLYRVEVNGVDTATGVITSLLWDRDNASLVSLITDVGPTVTLASFGPDPVHSFGGGQTVTISDAHLDVSGQPLHVCTTSDPQASNRTLTLTPAPTGVDADARPRLRLWSGELTGVTPGTVVPLELGLSVVIDKPNPGDYWLIPARTALGGPGGLDWPSDSVGTFRAQPANGPEEHWARLALVDFDGTNVTAITDCRKRFPPLTAITAADVSYDPAVSGLTATDVQTAIDELSSRAAGGCTITVSPVANWAAEIVVPPGGDARICFRAGTFETAQRVTLTGTGHLVLEGVAAGSLLRARADEVALLLQGWASVTVRDLAFVGTSPSGGNGMNGALTVIGSAQVRVESVLAACASATSPRAACVTLAGPDPASVPPLAAGVTGPTRATVSDCTLITGEYQVGLIVRDFAHCDVSGVLVTPIAEKTFTSLNTLPKALRGKLKPLLLQGITASATPPPAAPPAAPPGPAPAPAVSSRVARFTGTSTKLITSGALEFRTPGPVAQAWRNVLAANPAPAALAQARKHVLTIAGNLLKPSAPLELKPFRDILNDILADRLAVIAQGIVVAGTHAGTVQISCCSVTRAIQGVHVAVSQQEAVMGTPLSADRVVVRDCTIEVLVPTEAARLRHGIFVGNTHSALIADNVVTLTNQAINDRVPTDGIRVWGVLGNDVVVRDNSATGFPVGVRFVADARSVTGKIVRWRIRDNLLPAQTPVITTDVPGQGNRIIVMNNVPLP